MGRDILVVAEHRKGTIDDVTFELLGKGKELKQQAGGALHVACLGAARRRRRSSAPRTRPSSSSTRR
jgi:electron transfer flavoprotein alpha subunit